MMDVPQQIRQQRSGTRSRRRSRASGRASKRRCGVKTRPSKMPQPKISMECLFSRPNPATMPNQIQSFASAVLMMRISRQAHPIQNKASNAFMESSYRVARKPGATRWRGQRDLGQTSRPPSSRAITAVSSDLDLPRPQREEADGGERVTKQRASDPGDQRNQRRLIHITPIQMPAARQIIKLVNEIAVMPARIQVNEQLEGSNAKQQFGCGGCVPAAFAVGRSRRAGRVGRWSD